MSTSNPSDPSLPTAGVGPCLSCPSHTCGWYYPNTASTINICLCGHDVHSHVPPSTQPRHQQLEDRGGIPMVGCTGFVGRAYSPNDRCEACRYKWQAHGPPPGATFATTASQPPSFFDSSAASPLSTAATAGSAASTPSPTTGMLRPVGTPTTLTPWNNPTITSTGGTTASRREEAIVRHRAPERPNAFATAPAVLVPAGMPGRSVTRRGHRRQYGTGGRGTTTGVRTPAIQDVYLGISLWPHAPRDLGIHDYQGWSAPTKIRQGFVNRTTQQERIRAEGLEFGVTLSSIDPPDVNLRKIEDGLQALRRNGVEIPSSPNSNDTRRLWGLLVAGNEPVTVGSQRIYNHHSPADHADWWTLINIVKIARKDWPVPQPVPPQRPYDHYIYIDTPNPAVNVWPTSRHIMGRDGCNVNTGWITPASSSASSSSRSLLVRGRSDSMEIEAMLNQPSSSRRRSNTRNVSPPSSPAPTPPPPTPSPEPQLCPTNWTELIDITQDALAIPTASHIKWEIDASGASTVEDAVDVLFDYFYSRFSPGTITPRNVPEVVLEGADLPLRYLLSTEETVNVLLQEGQGLAPARELFTAAVHRMLKEPGFWDATVDGFVTLNLTIPVNEQRLLLAQVYGALTLIHLVQCEWLPPDISPAFLQAVIKGSSSVVDDDGDWIKRFAPSIKSLFYEFWPSDAVPSLPDSVYSWMSSSSATPEEEEEKLQISHFLEILNELNITLDTFKRLPLDIVGKLRRSALEQKLLGVPLGAKPFDENEYVKAFRSGFDIVIGGGITGTKLMGLASKDLLARLTPTVISTAQQVLQRITWKPKNTDAEGLATLERRFKKTFEHWIRGSGHPKHPSILQAVSISAQEEVEGSLSFRPVSFSRLVSSSPILSWYDFKFVEPSVRISAGSWSPIRIRACDHRIEVSITAELEDAIESSYEEEDLNEVTEMDLLLHSFFAPLDNHTNESFNAV
ncbi:hypothetical protein VNI00_004484 [Paramarasmius palmivorus]|uniref:HECT domain-containing protein n=1 Tax=Paramarasmius palmivorus TaxID=297713 RepID=A0AAW0DJD7_9AGAR